MGVLEWNYWRRTEEEGKAKAFGNGGFLVEGRGGREIINREKQIGDECVWVGPTLSPVTGV